MTVSPDLLSLLVCPKSKAPLEHYAGPPEVLVCRASRLVYPVHDGIPIMLIDEALPLDDAVYPAPAEGPEGGSSGDDRAGGTDPG